MVFVSSWRLLAFSQNFAFESKARQKYCEKGAPSGVVGSCPRIVWPISSGHAALVVQNGRQRFIEKLITIIQKSIGNHEKSIPNRPKWCPETIQKQSRQQVDSRNGPRRHRPLFPGPILRPWGDLGRHLGTQLGAKGSQNRAFWCQVAPKCRKMRPRMRHQKIY